MRTVRRISLDGHAAIEFIARIPHRTAMVWEAALTPEGLSSWIGETVDYEPHEGGDITLTESDGKVTKGVITDYAPGKRIAFATPNDEVRILVTPIDGTTDFVLINALANENEAARSAATWHERVARMAKQLDAAEPQRSWQDLYAHYVSEGFEHGATPSGNS